LCNKNIPALYDLIYETEKNLKELVFCSKYFIFTHVMYKHHNRLLNHSRIYISGRDIFPVWSWHNENISTCNRTLYSSMYRIPS